MELNAQAATQLQKEVVEGLEQPYKTIPCKYLYDEQGSRLFDRICELDEYYPTRTELHIMEEHLQEILAAIPDNSLLIELGSGSSVKTRLLLNHHKKLAAYVPVDISHKLLMDTAQVLQKQYPGIPVIPIVADYTHPFEIGDLSIPHDHTVVYYPGSTIGNFLPSKAKKFLRQIAGICKQDDGFLVGVDLKKDPSILEAAYNDREGITARFNKNLLLHINRELNADFDISLFAHEAIYNQALGRIEMHLVSLAEQDVRIADTVIHFSEGESIHTENSYKYEIEGFRNMAAEAGFEPDKVWTDPDRYFSIQYFRVKEAA